MATKDTVVQELVVNTLTQAQFDAAKEAGTLSPYELYGTPDTSVRLPVLTPMWFDHITNDVSWLRADTFSWQSGDVYVAAYEHLLADFEGTTAETETIADITIAFYRAEDGHKICLPDQEANVSALYESTGVAWYYILDTENKQFKLPRSKHNKYASTLPVAGTGLALGLTQGNDWYFGLCLSEYSAGVRADAYGANVGQTGGQNYSDYRPALGVTEDPTKSGIIAQQIQDTDQYKYLYFYVGNFERDAVEQTAGINAELFNGKLDLELGNANAATKSTVVGWGVPDYSAGVSFTPAVGTTFTAPTDGVALVYLSVTGGNGNLVLNGATIGLFGGSNANHNNFSLPVNKGDTITVTMNTGAIGNSIGNFYPLKGAN